MALAVLAVSVYVFAAAREFVYLDSTGPGGGFFPAWVGGLGVLIALALLLSLRERTVRSYEAWRWPERAAAWRIGATVLAVAVAALVLERAGFRLTMFALLVAVLRACGVSAWWRLLLVAAVGSLLMHFLFQRLLKVQLPTGILGF
jgi:putative tricarboxylic transport membrane protein